MYVYISISLSLSISLCRFTTMFVVCSQLTLPAQSQNLRSQPIYPHRHMSMHLNLRMWSINKYVCGCTRAHTHMLALCVYIFRHMHVQHEYTYIHTYIPTYVRTYIHTHTHIHTYIYTYTRTHTHTHSHTYTHTHIRAYIHTYTHTRYT